MNKALILMVALVAVAQIGCTSRMAAAAVVGGVIGAAVVASATDDDHDEDHHHHRHCRHRSRHVDVYHHHGTTHYDVVYIRDHD